METMLGLDLQYKKVSNHNIIFAYTDSGIGEQTLLFLHGLGNSLIGFEKNLSALSANYRCIGLDLPGNGFSSKDNYPYSMQFYVDSVASFLKEMDLSNIVLVGHSMGAQISILLAYHYPALVSKLILIAPAGLERFTAMEKIIMTSGMGLFDFGMTDESKLRQALHSSFFSTNTASQSLINTMIRMLDLQPASHYKKMVDKSMTAMLEEPVTSIIPLLNQSTLILFGTMDALIPNKFFHPESTSTLALKSVKSFQHGTLELIPHAGHFVHYEKAKEVNQIIQNFVNN